MNRKFLAFILAVGIFIMPFSLRGDVFSFRIDAGGADFNWPRVCYAGKWFVVVFHEIGTDNDPHITTVCDSVTLYSDKQWAISGSSSPYPDVASCATDTFIMVYREGDDIKGQQFAIDSDGHPSSIGSEITVRSGTAPELPRVAWGGTNYLVAWQENDNIYGQLVSKDGSIVNGRISICTDAGIQQNADVSESGDEVCLVVWENRNTTPYSIYAQRVNSNTSATIGSAIWVSEEYDNDYGENSETPSVAWGSSRWTVVWDDYGYACGQRVETNGALYSTTYEAGGSGVSPLNPGIAWDTTRKSHLIVWHEPGDDDIHGDENSNKSDTKDFIIKAGTDFRCSQVSADGAGHYLVVWEATTEDTIVGGFWPSSPDCGNASVAEEPAHRKPLTENRKLHCYPNPFTQETHIVFSISHLANDSDLSGLNAKLLNAKCCIYDLAGQLVKSLPITEHRTPITEVVWDGRDAQGKIVSPGIYFVKLITEDTVRVSKITKLGKTLD